jgi:hypothetical protein
VSQTCWVDGVERRFSDLLKDPNDWRLVTHLGVLKNTRQPGVNLVTGTKISFPTNVSSQGVV